MHETASAAAMAELPLVAILRGLRPERGRRRSAKPWSRPAFACSRCRSTRPSRSPASRPWPRLCPDARDRRRHGDRACPGRAAGRRGRAARGHAAQRSRGDRSREGRRPRLPARRGHADRRLRGPEGRGGRVEAVPGRDAGAGDAEGLARGVPEATRSCPWAASRRRRWRLGGRRVRPASGSGARCTSLA